MYIYMYGNILLYFLVFKLFSVNVLTLFNIHTIGEKILEDKVFMDELHVQLKLILQ